MCVLDLWIFVPMPYNGTSAYNVNSAQWKVHTFIRSSLHLSITHTVKATYRSLNDYSNLATLVLNGLNLKCISQSVFVFFITISTMYEPHLSLKSQWPTNDVYLFNHCMCPATFNLSSMNVFIYRGNSDIPL